MKSTETDAGSQALNLHFGTMPSDVTARGGGTFDPRENRWIIREGSRVEKLDFDRLPQMSGEFRTSLKAALVWYAQNCSLMHTINMLQRTKHLLEFKVRVNPGPVGEITGVDLLNYKASLGDSKGWYLSALSGFLKKWQELYRFGISEDAVVLLKQWRLKGNPKGTATATACPTKGPLTSTELEALQHALNDAYGRHEVSLAEYSLCWLFMALGQRPVQYALLKVCDLEVAHGKDGSVTYVLRIPRAKTRRDNPRGQFKERLLTPQIGKLVLNHAVKVRTAFNELLDDVSDAPLFPALGNAEQLSGYAYHHTPEGVIRMLNGACASLKVQSERTGELMKIFATRFRRTVGTRAAEEGHGELVIAELLDHSDTQNVGVYVGSTPVMVERIDRAVAMKLAPLAQAFAGKLIRYPSEASRALDPSSQIRAPEITGSFEGVSSCGKHGFCGFLKPIACYTCSSFEPWLDGPHEQVLKHLLSERERLMANGDGRTAAINDRTIYAVAEVIQLCAEVRVAGDVRHG